MMTGVSIAAVTIAARSGLTLGITPAHSAVHRIPGQSRKDNATRRTSRFRFSRCISIHRLHDAGAVELVELEKELEIVEAQEIDLDPAEGEEVTYDGLAPHLEEELKEQRYENEASIEVLVMEIKAIRETGVVI